MSRSPCGIETFLMIYFKQTIAQENKICEENLNKNAKYRIFTTEVYSSVLRKEEIIRTSVFNKFNHKLYEELY